MKKIYSLITTVLLGVTSSVSAVNVNLTEEATTPEGYRVTRLYNFVAGSVNNGEQTITDGLVLSDVKEDFKLNKWETYQVKNEGFENFYIAIGTAALNVTSTHGLRNYGSGSRWFAINDIKEGQVIVFDAGQTESRDFDVSPLSTNVVNLTDSIHAVQESMDNDGDGEPDNVNDGLVYWRMTETGRVDVALGRGMYCAAIAIMTSDNAPETIDNPTQKLASVDGSYRKITVKSSSSSYGNPTKVYYSLDGSSPINMRDTDVELRKDTTWVTNEEGEIVVDEEGNPQIDHIDIVYVQEPVQDESGEWGDWIYENEIEISEGDDEDGDGFVTVSVACITDEGVMSTVSSVTYSVGDIVLNAPVLTLVGMSETARNYQLSWTNNTLCEEDYVFTYEANTGEAGEMYIGDIISLTDGVVVTVSAEGYTDGVLVMNEVDRQGVSYSRKNAELAAEGQHDWDFQNLSEDMLKMLEGKVVDYYYTLTYNENGEVIDTVKYDAEKIDNGEIEEPDNMETAYKYYGWNEPEAGKYRTTLHVIVDTLVNEETGEITTNAYYDEEKTGVFDGLTINCPPNAANNSCIFIYTNTELGAYFMAKPTITVDNTVYGEYVVMGLGYGGSNYTTSTWSTCEMNENPEGPYETTLASGTHVFYIDIYTSNDLPDIIEKVEGNNATFANVYSIDGRLVRANANVGNALNGLAKGIYIMNGKKYLVK
ncbi:MAG: hypothetical protein NC206_10560 [Bacteroides sp.]|nr:hypothetical protein [Roseburia sp.]MCM1347509.1 hypothetical protein [Bacteroides sp.]MCM1422012.1 hypothetical protein [Bacteroides sp.]